MFYRYKPMTARDYMLAAIVLILIFVPHIFISIATALLAIIFYKIYKAAK